MAKADSTVLHMTFLARLAAMAWAEEECPQATVEAAEVGSRPFDLLLAHRPRLLTEADTEVMDPLLERGEVPPWEAVDRFLLRICAICIAVRDPSTLPTKLPSTRVSAVNRPLAERLSP